MAEKKKSSKKETSKNNSTEPARRGATALPDVEVSGNTLSYDWTGLNPSKSYQFTVVAQGFAGDSPSSASVQATPLAPPSGSISTYVADTGNHLIRKVTPEGVVTTFAGSTSGYANGIGTSAQFNNPTGVATDSAGNLYVADTNNHRIRKVTTAGEVTLLAGAGDADFGNGTGAAAYFRYPKAVAVDSAGNVYVADTSNHAIRKITSAGVVTTLAGDPFDNSFADGTGAAAHFYQPSGVAVDSSGNVYVSDKFHFRIRKITPAGEVTTLAGDGTSAYTDGTGASAQFKEPRGLSIDSSGDLYVADGHHVRKVTSAGQVTTLAGGDWADYVDGTGSEAFFNLPVAVAVDSSDDVYVSDANNNRIRKVTQEGVTTTFVGSTNGSADGTGTAAQFSSPQGIAIG
jgi:hypothetical protein